MWKINLIQVPVMSVCLILWRVLLDKKLVTVTSHWSHKTTVTRESYCDERKKSHSNHRCDFDTCDNLWCHIDITSIGYAIKEIPSHSFYQTYYKQYKLWFVGLLQSNWKKIYFQSVCNTEETPGLNVSYKKVRNGVTFSIHASVNILCKCAISINVINMQHIRTSIRWN